MELYRSQDMTYVALTMTNEATYQSILQLGQYQQFHPVDLSNPAQPHKQQTYYKKRIMDCLTLEKKLTMLEQQVQQFDIPMNTLPADQTYTPTSNTDALELVQTLIEPLENELVLSLQFQQENARTMNTCLEHQNVIRVLANTHFSSTSNAGKSKMELAQQALTLNRTSSGSMLLDAEYDSVLVPGDQENAIDVEANTANGEPQFRNIIAGMIPTAHTGMMQRLVYRLSRGNAYARFTAIDNEEFLESGSNNMQEKVKKSVFYVVVLGQHLHTRLIKMCETVRASVYTVPQTSQECQHRLTQLQDTYRDQLSVHERTDEQVRQLLLRLVDDSSNTGSNPLRQYQAILLRERRICELLMKAHWYATMVALEGWVPSASVSDLRKAMKEAVKGSGHPPAAIELAPVHPLKKPKSPPTNFPINKFTSTFQGIVDTYGVPRYKEVNPGLFTIITFPFLFGVMYGDIGHGTLLTLFSMTMIKYEKKLQAMLDAGTLGEIPSMAFGGRYVMVCMGMFAVYCGIIYNDCFSIPFAFYQSAFTQDSTTLEYSFNGNVYPLGLDWKWAHKSNELQFYNSFKMKMSVTLGVTQMLFGICLSLSNHLYFGDKISIYFEFIPRMIFMCSTFGYMIFMILLKWMVDWTQSPVAPPNLIQTMISMFLSVGNVDPEKQLYGGQAGFQTLLVLMALFSVPVMLVGKPYANKRLLAQKKLQGVVASQVAATNAQLSNDFELVRQHSDENVFETMAGTTTLPMTSNLVGVPGTTVHDLADDQEHNKHAAGHDGEEHEEHSFSDEMIHQAIHTIEFVLGCVSNTASYLRLWALSLAHAQLSSVFWDKMIIQYGISTGSAVSTFIGMAVWAAATFGVLLAMDVLECFLHALRLHWVEFQSKFYYADGYQFEPFTFDARKQVA